MITKSVVEQKNYGIQVEFFTKKARENEFKVMMN
jgi:hypothetical protein